MYHDYLAAVDRSRRDAIAARDVDTLRRITLHAVAFAAMTIQCPTDRAESAFADWAADGTVGAYLRTNRTRAITTAATWLNTLDVDAFAVDGWAFAEAIAANVVGLGVAKASFAAALAGHPEPYCLDVWGLRRSVALGLITDISERDRLFRGPKRWANYRRIGGATFADRAAQWDYFAATAPTFGETGHRVYFAALGLA